ncbi:fibronectin type III domain-containing protein, partial [bacterium]|nr:fibronectin type III domain-containing protein [bacterium]
MVSGSVEKWDASSGSWIDASPMPTSGNPQELLEVLRDRTIFEGDRLRWSAGGTPTGERTEAFGVVGWSEQAGSTPSIPAEVPTAVEGLAIAITGDDAFTLVWDRPTNGDATSYTATFSNGSQTSITITDATTVGYQPLSPVGSYTFTVTASNEVGTSDASQTSYATPIDQTITTTMVTPWSGAYQLVVSEVDTEAASLPTLQSFAKATYDGEWVMLAGRTNGLHNFTADGIKNFPPKYQNSDVWVVDPATQQVWSRSLTDASSGLSQTQIDSLSATNTLWQQDGDTLFVAGGYVYDSTTNNFTTYNALTALDLPSVVRWVKGEDATLGANAILQVAGDEATDGSYEGGFFQATGGGLHQLEDRFFLVFGQNFEGPYIPGRNGVYTSQ